MSEYDTFDLQAAFTALERDLTGISTAPGAGRAVAGARRRRRRTTIGAVAALAALAVGGVVGQGLSGHGNAVGPADGLPDPRPIDAASLTDATTGWTAAWESTGGSKEELVAGGVPTACLERTIGAATPEPSRTGEQGLLAGQAVAFIAVADFGQDGANADNAWQAYTDGAASCADARQTDDYTSGSAQVIRYTVTPGAPDTDQYVWLVRVADQMGVAWIANAADPLPADVGDRVTHAMEAGVLAPGSYSDSQGDTTGGNATAFVSSDVFASVLGSWASGWSATDGNPPTSLPCGVDLATGQQSGASQALGANGEQELFGYSDAALATQQLQTAVSQLRTCASYDVQQETLPDGAVRLVAAGPAGGQVVWIVGSGRSLDLIQVPASDTPPPAQVDSGVAKLLLGSLESWSSGGTSPTASGKTQAR
jgi:hypothetical protein